MTQGKQKMKKTMLLYIWVVAQLFFIKPVFADDCHVLNEKLEGKWTYTEVDVEHVVEFYKGDKFIIFDGEQKQYFSCYYFKYSNVITVTFKERFKRFSFHFPKDGENTKDIQLEVNWKKFNLTSFEKTSNELLSENNLAGQNGFSWKPEIGFDGQVFPSLLISTATWSSDEGQKHFSKSIKNAEYLGDLNSPVKVIIKNVESETKIRLEVDLGSIANPSMFEGVLAKENTVYVVKPRIDFDYQVLLASKQPMPLNAKLTLYVNDEKVGEKLQTITVRSINDVPISAKMGEKGELENDYSYVFAAYVNENNPLIDLLLREAIDTGVVDSHGGYQGGEEEVYKQVFSVWNILQRRGLRYSSITTPTGHSDKVFSQYVRFFDDAIATSQANCIDGTVLIASILRRIGINPKIVVVPGHAFLAFDLDESGKKLAFLETTMMGNTDLQKYSEGYRGIAGDVARLLGSTKNQASRKSFIAALQEGQEKANKARSKLLNGNDPNYKIIDIDAARKMGIAPINH